MSVRPANAGAGGDARPPSPSQDDLAAFYADGYTVEDTARARELGRWRALGARGKAAHVLALCDRAGLRPARVVEIGCGDGALLARLGELGFGTALDGFELSAPAARIAAARGIPRAGRIEPYDGTRVPAPDGAYDLAILSHVVEHVPEPVALLREAARVAPWVLIEVPLEANRSARRPVKRAEAARIGHLHAFDRSAVARLAAAAGLDVRHALADPLPLPHHAFFAHGLRPRAAATAKWAVRVAAHRVAPRAAERAFTVHYAALATAGQAVGPTASREASGQSRRAAIMRRASSR